MPGNTSAYYKDVFGDVLAWFYTRACVKDDG